MRDFGHGRWDQLRARRRERPALAIGFATLLLAGGARGQDDGGLGGAPPPASDAASPRIPLDGRWDLVLDKDDSGVQRGMPAGTGPGWERALKVGVPGPLEASVTANSYDGIVWYRVESPAAKAPPGGHLLLQFDEANWRADAWLEGEPLGRHDGPGAFRFDVTGKLDAAGRRLVVRVVDPGEKLVDDLLLAALPSGREGWFYNVGGLLGPVSLLPAGPVLVLRHDVRLLPDGAAQLRVDLAGLDPTRDIVLKADLGGVLGEARATLVRGESTFTLDLPGAESLARWSPDAPMLHPLTLTVQDTEENELARLAGRAGLRRFVADGSHFALDGQAIRLHGVTYPAFYPRGLSRPPEADFLRRELAAIKEAGFNLVRVEQRIAPEVWEICDELGLLVHAEPPLGRLGHELPVTAAALDGTLVAFSQAVQGHPSVVMVSLLDEGGGLLWRREKDLLRRMQGLLPERLLLSDSGGATGDTQLLNPHESSARLVNDVRFSVRWPWDEAQRAQIDALGSDDRLTYVSRWSAGGLPAFHENVAGFGSQLTTPDASEAVQRLQDVSTQLAGTPLQQVVGDLSQLTALGQALEARAVRSVAAALRTQGRLAGECYGNWRDLSWQDAEGLCDVWGRAKPALAAMRQYGSPPPPLGELPARASKVFATGSLAGLTPGVQAIVSRLVGRPGEVYGVPRLAIAGENQIGWTPDKVSVTVALLRFVRDGGTLLLLAPPDAGRPFAGDVSGDEGAGQVADLPVDVAARPLHRPDQHGLLLFADKSPLLADIPVEAPLLDDRLAAVAPAHVLYSPPAPGLDVELACVDARGRYVGAAVQAVPYGKGQLILSTLRLTDETIADPVAARVLENLVRYTAGLAARKAEPPPTAADAPPDELREPIQQHVWRYKIWFGLAERMACARIPGLPPSPRVDSNELPTMVMRKNTGLDLIVQGKAEEGDKILALIDGGALLGDRERFLRNEVSFSEALRTRAAAEPPLVPAERLELLGLHARALRLLRMNEAQAGVGTLDQALDSLQRSIKAVGTDGG